MAHTTFNLCTCKLVYLLLSRVYFSNFHPSHLTLLHICHSCWADRLVTSSFPKWINFDITYLIDFTIKITPFEINLIFNLLCLADLCVFLCLCVCVRRTLCVSVVLIIVSTFSKMLVFFWHVFLGICWCDLCGRIITSNFPSKFVYPFLVCVRLLITSKVVNGNVTHTHTQLVSSLLLSGSLKSSPMMMKTSEKPWQHNGNPCTMKCFGVRFDFNSINRFHAHPNLL